VHLYVERPHCLSLSIVGPTAATAAADDADNLDISGIDIRRSVGIKDVLIIAFDEKLLPEKNKQEVKRISKIFHYTRRKLLR
jgi:hypothetical protein